MTDPFDLDRFVRAQDADGTYEQALAELRAGRKRSHCMWFVFPQLAGLGRSATARRYAISSLDEARAYVAHPVLGPRLHESAHVVADAPAPSVEHLLDGVDALKLHSSATLFALAVDDAGSPFAAVLARWFGGRPDGGTLTLLDRAP